MNIDIYHSLSYRGRKKIYVYGVPLILGMQNMEVWQQLRTSQRNGLLISQMTQFFLLSFKVNIDKFWHFVSYSLEHSSENEKLVAYLLLLLFCFRSLFLMLSSLYVNSFLLSSYTCWLFVPSTFFSLLSEFSTVLFAWLAIVQIMRHYFHVDRAFA